MKFLCSAVVLLTAISKTSASGYFDAISPLDHPRTKNLPPASSSSPSYFSFSSSPSMTSKPVPALSPKPELRENDLAAKTQVAKQGGRENEQPRSVVYSGSRSSSGSNDSSSSSPSMPSSIPPKQPKSIMDTAYDNLHEAVYNNDGLKVKELLRISPFIIRSSVFAKSSPSRNSELLYEVLMSMKSELSPYDFKEYAKKLLPHLGSNTRSALEAIISSGPSSSPSMPSSVPPKQPKSIMDTACDNLYNAVYNNDEKMVKELLLVSPFIVRSLVFVKSSPSRNSELLYEVLMSMKSELSPYDFKEYAKKLLPHLGSNTRSALEAIISA